MLEAWTESRSEVPPIGGKLSGSACAKQKPGTTSFPAQKTRPPLFRGVYTWVNSWVYRYIGISLFSDIHMGFPKLRGLHVSSKLLLSFSGGLVNGFGHTLTHQENHNAVVSNIKTSKFYDVLWFLYHHVPQLILPLWCETTYIWRQDGSSSTLTDTPRVGWWITKAQMLAWNQQHVYGLWSSIPSWEFFW